MNDYDRVFLAFFVVIFSVSVLLFQSGLKQPIKKQVSIVEYEKIKRVEKEMFLHKMKSYACRKRSQRKDNLTGRIMQWHILEIAP